MTKPIDITGQRFGRLTAVDYVTKNGRRLWRCACDCGGETFVIVSELRNGKRFSCGCAAKDRNSLVGKRFGKLVAIERAEYITKGRPRWLCQCDCGNHYTAESRHLNNGEVTNCGCHTSELRSANKRKAPGEAMRNRVLASYKRNAQKRGLPFELTNEQVFELFQGDCYYCGEPPSIEAKSDRLNGSYKHNGIDRLDSMQGYLVGNVESCCTVCNYMKRAMNEQQFINHIAKILSRRDGSSGGTANCANYAASQGKDIIRLHPQEVR